MNEATAAHYAKQWGRETGYTDFIRSTPSAEKFTMGRQLGWLPLFGRIRALAGEREVSVYDAACGFGNMLFDLFADPVPKGLSYLGADIHGRLHEIDNTQPGARLMHWDISERLPGDAKFDFVLCRAAIHHTPDPPTTFRKFVEVLKPGGSLAISAYAKKAPMREAVDDALRSAITGLSPDKGMEIASQFSALGRDLQASAGEIAITTDLPFLGINAGRYPIHEFIYDHLIKCWFNPEFGERSDIVNFDWYHPPYAYRYELAELESWFRDSGLEVTSAQSNKAQHYVEGVLRGQQP